MSQAVRWLDMSNNLHRGLARVVYVLVCLDLLNLFAPCCTIRIEESSST